MNNENIQNCDIADRHVMETAYCFLHQKQRVYQYSNMDWQKEDIEYAIADYADQMDKRLYEFLAEGNPDFLHNHATFGAEIVAALHKLESLLGM